MLNVLNFLVDLEVIVDCVSIAYKIWAQPKILEVVLRPTNKTSFVEAS